MTSFRRCFFVLPIALSLAACGGSTAPSPTDAGGGTDTGARVDGEVPEDAGSLPDGEAADGALADASTPTDMCIAPRCPPIPVGCRLEPSPDPCLCGVIKCEDGGVPGSPCGGFVVGGCGPLLFCDFTEAFDCGFADGAGFCAPRPDACPDVEMPVCGCDGTTYSNSCDANANGVDVAADGECTVGPPPPIGDCRTTGCPAGNHCDACRTPGGAAYVCLPDGAIC